MRKTLLAVIDGCKPSMLQRAVERGEAPAIAAVLERGTFVPELCAAFPSVTPVCATSIATGVLQDRHRIAAMNWWSRDERRYVEYGSSFRAARKLGIGRQLTDTVYNLNGPDLRPDGETVYESLDDAGVRTAGTTYLVYRGRHEHRVSRETALTRLASQLFRKPAMGPREVRPARPSFPKAGEGPARALLRRHLLQPRDGLPQPDGAAGDPRPAL